MGQCHASISLGWAKDGIINTKTDTLYLFLTNELLKVGHFTCERNINHSFQCDCDEKMGCHHFIKVSWDPTTL